MRRIVAFILALAISLSITAAIASPVRACFPEDPWPGLC